MNTPGQYRKVVTVRQPSATGDAYSTADGSYTDAYTTRCSLMPLRGSDLNAAKQVNAQTQYKVRMRYRSDIVAETRLVIDGVEYEIVGHPTDPSMKKRELEIMVKTVG